jgi:hypothetical protein
VCMGLCDPMENPTRESCEGGFLQYFREEIWGFHDLVRQKLSSIFILLGWSSILITSLMIHHRPSNRHAVLSTLVHRARALCDHDSLNDELRLLRDTFKQNGYSDWQIFRAFNPIMRVSPPTDKPNSVTFLLMTCQSQLH